MGKVFLEQGVRHVVCVKEMKEVLDEAALTFTKYFYKDILNQKTVCDAFKAAKNNV